MVEEARNIEWGIASHWHVIMIYFLIIIGAGLSGFIISYITWHSGDMILTGWPFPVSIIDEGKHYSSPVGLMLNILLCLILYIIIYFVFRLIIKKYFK